MTEPFEASEGAVAASVSGGGRGGKALYGTGLAVDFVLFLPSLYVTFGGVAAIGLGVHPWWEIPLLAVYLLMPLIDLACIAAAINQRSRGRISRAIWLAWTPPLVLGLLALLFLLGWTKP